MLQSQLLWSFGMTTTIRVCYAGSPGNVQSSMTGRIDCFLTCKNLKTAIRQSSTPFQTIFNIKKQTNPGLQYHEWPPIIYSKTVVHLYSPVAGVKSLAPLVSPHHLFFLFSFLLLTVAGALPPCATAVACPVVFRWSNSLFLVENS